MKYLVKPNYI